jgi:hypothetical protein
MDPIAGQLFQHFKGGFYIVIAVGKHSETEEDMVCYRAASEETYWFRPLRMWDEMVEHNGKKVPRFRLITAHSRSEQKRIEAQIGLKS